MFTYIQCVLDGRIFSILKNFEYANNIALCFSAVNKYILLVRVLCFMQFQTKFPLFTTDIHSYDL